MKNLPLNAPDCSPASPARGLGGGLEPQQRRREGCFRHAIFSPKQSTARAQANLLPYQLRWCCIAGIDIHPSADSREECHRNAHVVRDLVAVRALKFLRGDLEGCSLDNVGFAAREPDYRMMGLAARCDPRVFTFHQRLFKARQTIRRVGKPSIECSELHGLKLQRAVGKQELNDRCISAGMSGVVDILASRVLEGHCYAKWSDAQRRMIQNPHRL